MKIQYLGKSFLIGLNIVMDKNCFNLDVFMQINRSLLKYLLCSRNRFSEKSYEQYDKQFLVVGDSFMPKAHLRQSKFASSTCGPFTKNKEWIHKLKKKTSDSRYLNNRYLNNLDKACFQ